MKIKFIEYSNIQFKNTEKKTNFNKVKKKIKSIELIKLRRLTRERILLETPLQNLGLIINREAMGTTEPVTIQNSKKKIIILINNSLGRMAEQTKIQFFQKIKLNLVMREKKKRVTTRRRKNIINYKQTVRMAVMIQKRKSEEERREEGKRKKKKGEIENQQ